MKSIEQKNTLINALRTGINLFVGAGFSVLAKDGQNRTMPVGNQLAEELSTELNIQKMELPIMSTILESSKRQQFRKFLTDRFNVKSFDPLYDNINRISIKNLYTTNIDNLIPQIIEKSTSRFLNDQRIDGSSPDKNAINYLALHGNVSNPDSGYVFSSSSIATIYNDDTRIWNYVTMSMENHPTIFIGYSFNDVGTFNAIFSRNSFQNAQKDKWIVILESEEDKEPYYKALGFNIIYGNTKDFLEWIPTIEATSSQKATKPSLKTIFPQNIVPQGKYDNTSIVRPIEEFFRGATPVWNDIIGGQIYKTSYFKEIQDSIHNPKKNTIIIGAPATGKTTLAMQVAYNINFAGEKLIFDNLTDSKVDYIAKVIDNAKTLVIIENFTDNIDAFNKLHRCKNIKLVGIDRSHFFGIISHLIETNNFDVINTSGLTDSDLQGVFSSLPSELKYAELKKENRGTYSMDTMFEFVQRNIKKSNIAERYQEVVNTLVANDPLLAEFIILCSYSHASRIPLSSEMAIAYFKNDCSYSEVFQMRADVYDLVKDYDDYFIDRDEDIDYYYPKSYYIAESIIRKCPRNILKTVINKFIANLSPVQICSYNTFKKHGFDKNIISKAFDNTNEGKEFYEKAFMFDYQNPFVLQQGALFLCNRGSYDDAFQWIDRALNMTNDKYFSIRNSHAVILFDANIRRENVDARVQLDNSMAILERCINNDKRTTFHATQYANQAIEYAARYNDEISISYLTKSKKWLQEEYAAKKWNWEVKTALNNVNELISKFS